MNVSATESLCYSESDEQFLEVLNLRDGSRRMLSLLLFTRLVNTLLSNRQHLSVDDCLHRWTDDCQNCSNFYAILCTIIEQSQAQQYQHFLQLNYEACRFRFHVFLLFFCVFFLDKNHFVLVLLCAFLGIFLSYCEFIVDTGAIDYNTRSSTHLRNYLLCVELHVKLFTRLHTCKYCKWHLEDHILGWTFVSSCNSIIYRFFLYFQRVSRTCTVARFVILVVIKMISLH